MNAIAASSRISGDLGSPATLGNGHFVVDCPTCDEHAVTVPMCMSAQDVVRCWACGTRHAFGELLVSHEKTRRVVEAGAVGPVRLAS